MGTQTKTRTLKPWNPMHCDRTAPGCAKRPPSVSFIVKNSGTVIDHIPLQPNTEHSPHCSDLKNRNFLMQPLQEPDLSYGGPRHQSSVHKRKHPTRNRVTRRPDKINFDTITVQGQTSNRLLEKKTAKGKKSLHKRITTDYRVPHSALAKGTRRTTSRQSVCNRKVRTSFATADL